jgi:hypothetical protein
LDATGDPNQELYCEGDYFGIVETPKNNNPVNPIERRVIVIARRPNAMWSFLLYPGTRGCKNYPLDDQSRTREIRVPVHLTTCGLPVFRAPTNLRGDVTMKLPKRIRHIFAFDARED